MATLELEIDQGVGVLTLNRPERLNALTAEMVDDLGAMCRRIEAMQDVHVVILTGAGRAFCAGGDIDAWADQDATGFSRHWVRDGHEAFDRVARLRQPVIAALNGHVLGGGLELAVCADYRIAESHIKVGQPETGLGIVAGWSGTQRATRRFGAQLVRRMALFGEVFTAEQALGLGLVDQVVDTGGSLTAAHALAQTLRHKGPVATELTKMLINTAEGEEIDRVMDAFAGRIAAQHAELQTGLSAFKNRKTPDFWHSTSKGEEDT